MKRHIFVILCIVNTIFSFGQSKVNKIGDFIESISYNDNKRGVTRILQYRPEGEDFVCVNGKNRYTRALYGSHTAFRIETSDRPVFAAYEKKSSKNIQFAIAFNSEIFQPLDSTKFCEARYKAGCRMYYLSDSCWNGGKINISVLALTDDDGGIWKFNFTDMPQHAKIRAIISNIKAKKLNRNGDMGADPPDSFEASDDLQSKEIKEIAATKTAYLVLYKSNGSSRTTDIFEWLSEADGAAIYDKAEKTRAEIAGRLKITTPDPYINTLGGALAVAADGIWDKEVWLHGAIGWRMPLSGWRAAYTGDCLGWHDRARTHFNNYAASQVTNRPQTIPHPAQDTALHLARSRKEWGTPQYSNGYICRNPHNPNQMHHYDMNLCYIDELLWHFNWTGDLDYARKMWPVLKLHLEWEKRNFDPDNDGLYDAYACIWASDALYYNSGAVTHSSAYNYRANKMAALIAAMIGEDSNPYKAEAEKILKAINTQLWLKDKGHWAEFRDFMGLKRIHEDAAVWTVYHSIDSDIADLFQAYEATRYVDEQIPQIPVTAEGLPDGNYKTISTSDWVPYSWSINNVAFAEVWHTALAYFKACRFDEGFMLFKSSVLDGMYIGDSPANFGQISFYDAARGECYRDFGDPIGVASRVLVQGLFGVIPDAMNNQLILRPGFPSEWNFAEFSIPDINYSFHRNELIDTYSITMNFQKSLNLELQIFAQSDDIESLTVNGSFADWQNIESVTGQPMIKINMPAEKHYDIKIKWGKNKITKQPNSVTAENNSPIKIKTAYPIEKINDTQNILSNIKINDKTIEGYTSAKPGHHTLFILNKSGKMSWWTPIDITIKPAVKTEYEQFSEIKSENCEMVNFDTLLNDSVNNIYKEQYFSPRSPYTTLQIPTQGIGEWCHPLLTATIDDSGLRKLVKEDIFTTSLNIPFRIKKEGYDIAYTSLWDNYPDSITIPLSGKAGHLYLLMAGSTNHMQCHIPNGTITITYADGTRQEIQLINPDNWAPIEQDFYFDELAFRHKKQLPYRLHFKSGIVSRELGKELHIEGVYGREIENGAAILLDIPSDKSKTLKTLTVRTLSNDVIIGIMSITKQL